MPKNVLNPQRFGVIAPPVPEQAIRFDQARATKLSGYSPADSVASEKWTVAGWFKVTNDLATTRVLWGSWTDASNHSFLSLNPSGNLSFEARIAGVLEANFQTSRRLIDTSAWYHIMVVFASGSGQLDLYINGYLWTEWATSPVIAAVAGYNFLDSGADHAIGALPQPSNYFSGVVAELHCTTSAELVSAFGSFNALGVWTPIAYAGVYGSQGFYLNFGRTADLGEDFSGNNNDFPVHSNGGPTDQFNDWMDRNACTIDVNNSGTTGTVTEGGLVLAGGDGRVTMQPNAGMWYYERNGVAVVWDTGGSGRFNPLLDAATYNFGQLPFVDVGPSGGELLLFAPNLPASNIPFPRSFFSAIGFEGDGASPRVITAPAISQGDAEYAEILHRADLVWTRNMALPVPQQQAHRLRDGVLTLNDASVEAATLIQGYVSDQPAIGYEVTAGGSGDNNTNNSGDLISAVAWRVVRFAQNIRVQDDDDDAEEQISTGDVDAGSSDIELGSEDGGSGSAEQIVGLRFLDVRIPNAATINAAYIQFECDVARNDQPNELEIWMEDEDDPPTFIDGAGNDNISNRTRTSASVLWSPPEWDTDQERELNQRTPNIATAVKEVVDRGGWAPGQAMVSIIENEAGGAVGRHEAEAHDSSSPAEANEPMLQVSWQDSGFDPGISLFTYWGVNKVATVLHGLQAIPDVIVIKNASATDSWRMYHSQIQPPDLPAPEDGYLGFNLPGGAVNSSGTWNDTPPTFDVVTLGGSGAVNEYEEEYVGWAMREIEGFSKVFNYVGNGTALGPSVYCGFKPRMIVIKETGPGGNSWFFGHRAMGLSSPGNMFHNESSGNLLIDSITAAVQDDNLFIGANGFRAIDASGPINNLNSRYVGFAFAEVPFKSAKAAT